MVRKNRQIILVMIYTLLIGTLFVVLFAAALISAIAGAVNGMEWWMVTVISYGCMVQLTRRLNKGS